jgi:hypothetical protein
MGMGCDYAPSMGHSAPLPLPSVSPALARKRIRLRHDSGMLLR